MKVLENIGTFGQEQPPVQTVDHKALELVDFYNTIGWDSLLEVDLKFFIDNKFTLIYTESYNLFTTFPSGSVCLGTASLPVDYVGYLKDNNFNCIKITEGKELG